MSQGSRNENTKKHLLLDIRNNFLSAVPLKRFLNKDKADFIIQNADEILIHTVQHPINKARPLKQSYQLSFLKYIINLIENNGIEVYENIYTEYLILLNSCSHEDHFVHYFVKDRFVSIKEKASLISCGTTGLSVWQGGKVLAHYCSSNITKFKGKSVIELGSGLGLTGISTIIACELKMFCFTDVHEEVMRYLVDNVRINFGSDFKDIDLEVKDQIAVMEYKNARIIVNRLAWEEEELSEFYHTVKFDYILAADVIYDSTNFHSLCSMLTKLLSINKTAEVILSCTVRNPETLKNFFLVAHKYKLGERSLSLVEAWNSNYGEWCQVQIFSIVHR